MTNKTSFFYLLSNAVIFFFLTIASFLTESFDICAANKEYYHQWSVEECHGCSLDLSAFTIEELDNITSEYTLKNTVSLQLFIYVLHLRASLKKQSLVGLYIHHSTYELFLLFVALFCFIFFFFPVDYEK